MPPVCPQAAAYANARPRRRTRPARAFERLRPRCAEAHLAITGIRTTRQRSRNTPAPRATDGPQAGDSHGAGSSVPDGSRQDIAARRLSAVDATALLPRPISPDDAVARFARARGDRVATLGDYGSNAARLPAACRHSRAVPVWPSLRRAQRTAWVRPRPRRWWARVASTPPQCDARRVAAAGIQAAAVRPRIRAAPRCAWTAATGPGSAADLHDARAALTPSRAPPARPQRRHRRRSDPAGAHPPVPAPA